jgi:hypothetical protein
MQNYETGFKLSRVVNHRQGLLIIERLPLSFNLKAGDEGLIAKFISMQSKLRRLAAFQKYGQ